MPSLQVVDTSPIERTRSTPLEQAASSFSNRFAENRQNAQDSDALRSIYEQHQNDGDNLSGILRDVQTNTKMSPTNKVKTIEQILKFQEHNSKLQKQASMQMAQQQKAQKAQKEEEEKEAATERKIAYLDELAIERGRP